MTTLLTSRVADTLSGDDWPKVDFAPPRYHTAPTRRVQQVELEHYAVHLAQEAGLLLDPWEEWYFLESLKLREDNKWAALECGLCVSRQNGKGCHELNTEILTLNGWKTIGSLSTGDYVFGSDGNPTRVTRKSDVFLGERCYEVRFADGSRYVVDEDHLWPVLVNGYDAEVYALATGSYAEKVRAHGSRWVAKNLTTREIAKSRWVDARYDEKYERTKNAYRYRVQCDAVLQTPDADLPIDPYVFGLWLGDGSRGAARLTVGDEDRDFMRESLLAAGLEVFAERRQNTPWRPWNLAFRIPGTGSGTKDSIAKRLRRLGVFGNKYIPNCYLTASPEQRLALLQGLMDTDGSIGGQNKSPQVEFSTSIPALAETFHVLARSLGIRVVPKWRKTARKDNCRFLWTPTFNPFRLLRKADKFRPPEGQYRRQDRMAITGIQEVPSVPVQCIQVEAEDGVYLVGRTFTPTHNSILEARELLGLYVDEAKFPGVGALLAVHTAHEAKTAHEGFERLSLLIEGTPRLRAQLRGSPRRSEGGEVIRLLNGRRIRFRTRTSGGGRGLSGDLLIFDEAMILMQGVHEAVWPIVTARTNPQIWYTGSAVDKNEPLMDQHGIVFARVRKRGIAGDPDLLYMEWSLDYGNPDEVPKEIAEDPDSWEKTNPGLDVRLSRRIIAVEQRSLSRRGFARERLGVGDWPDPDRGNSVISEEAWKAAAVDEAWAVANPMKDPICLSVDVAPYRERSAIGIAGKNPAGKNQVEILKRFRGTSGVVPALVAFVKIHGRRTEIVVEGTGQAASLIPAMEAERLNVIVVTSGEHARGCGMFYDGIEGDPDNNLPATLNHLGDPALTAAVAGAAKRDLGDRWTWSRKDSTIDISPLVAVTLALYGFLRKRQSSPGVYDPTELLAESDEADLLFDESGLPPLDEEDL